MYWFSLTCLQPGPGLQPAHVPQPGIKPATFWSTGWCLTHWATQSGLQQHLLKRLSITLDGLVTLSKIILPCIWRFVSGLSVLLHLSVCPSLCQYHTGFDSCTFVTALKSESMRPPISLLFRIVLAIQSLIKRDQVSPLNFLSPFTLLIPES